MSLHDAYARLTPLEIAFPDRSVIDDLSQGVAREVEERGADDTELETFVTTSAVGALAREIRGPDAPPESTYPFAALLYQSVHFLRAGCPLFLLSTDCVRELVGPRGAAGSGPVVDPPSSAGYLQLPQHLVWAAGGGAGAERGDDPGVQDTAPESLDGVFWTVSSAGTLYALPISGLRPDRPGFGALPLPAAPMADAPGWLDAEMRASGEDFASALPGGELDRLYAVQAAGEVLKLLARFFVASGSDRLTRVDGPPAGAASAGGPRPSTLPYTRVSAGT